MIYFFAFCIMSPVLCSKTLFIQQTNVPTVHFESGFPAAGELYLVCTFRGSKVEVSQYSSKQSAKQKKQNPVEYIIQVQPLCCTVVGVECASEVRLAQSLHRKDVIINLYIQCYESLFKTENDSEPKRFNFLVTLATRQLFC